MEDADFNHEELKAKVEMLGSLQEQRVKSKPDTSYWDYIIRYKFRILVGYFVFKMLLNLVLLKESIQRWLF